MTDTDPHVTIVKSEHPESGDFYILDCKEQNFKIDCVSLPPPEPDAAFGEWRRPTTIPSMPTYNTLTDVHPVNVSSGSLVAKMGGNDKVNGTCELRTTRLVDDNDLVANAPSSSAAVLEVPPAAYVADQSIATTTRKTRPSTTTTGIPSQTLTVLDEPGSVIASRSRSPATTFRHPPRVGRTWTSMPAPPKPPRLSLGGTEQRLSYHGFSGGSARLSPSLIIRPPPLPLLNLPVLVTPGGSRINAEEEEAQKESKRSGLMNIPALPLQGPSRGTREDDLEDGEEEEEGGPTIAITGLDVWRHTGKRRSSFSAEKSTDEEEEESRNLDNNDRGVAPDRLSLSTSSATSRSTSASSSYYTARGELSPTMWEACHGNVGRARSSSCLLTGETTGFEVDASPLLNDQNLSPPRSPVLQRQNQWNDLKGKSKQREEDFDEGRGDRGAVSNGVARHIDIPPERSNSATGTDTVTGRPTSHKPYPLSISRHISAKLITKATGEGDLTQTLSSDSRGRMSPVSAPGQFPSRPPLLDWSASSTSKSGSILTQNAGMYRRASKSLIDVRSIEKKEKMIEKMVRDQEAEEESRRRGRKIPRISGVHESPGNLTREPSENPSVPESFMTAEEAFGEEGRDEGDGARFLEKGKMEDYKATKTTKLAPISEALHPLRRRRSMPPPQPPPYAGLGSHISSLRFNWAVQPREDEGKERLPSYSNEIHLRAIMPRKMEFNAPGELAKDRKWRRVLCVLEGTIFKVYKCPAGAGGASVIGEWWESRVGAGSEPSSRSHGSGPRVGSRVNDSRPDERLLDPTGEMLTREIELARERKNRETEQAVSQRGGHIPPQSATAQPKALGHHSSQSLGVLTTPKSALTFAVQLLKPSTRHKRSNSEIAPRPSFNVPRSSSGRTTPTTTASNHGTDSMRSHSPSTASTYLATPASSSGIFGRLSRPSTPTPSVGSWSAHPRNTVGHGTTTTDHGIGPPEPSDHSLRHAGHGSVTGGKGKRDALLEPDKSDLMRVYTMQHAESGLGKDYVKRPHVIRLRLEGEQFLLQAKNVESVISWIEGLQSAANVALDLDERPMPAGPMIPRRRRRRRRRMLAPAPDP